MCAGIPSVLILKDNQVSLLGHRQANTDTHRHYPAPLPHSFTPWNSHSASWVKTVPLPFFLASDLTPPELPIVLTTCNCSQVDIQQDVVSVDGDRG